MSSITLLAQFICRRSNGMNETNKGYLNKTGNCSTLSTSHVGFVEVADSKKDLNHILDGLNTTLERYNLKTIK